MLMNPSPRLGSTALFSACGHSYTVDDAVASAIFRGDLDPDIEEALRLAAAQRRASEEGLEAGDELQASSEKFRYQHDLISAGETEEWLEVRGLSSDDFNAWLYQRLAIELVTSANNPTQLPIPEDFPDLLRVHLWMSGRMDTLDEQLSRRIAADLEVAELGETLSTEPVMLRFMDRHRLDEGTLPGWLAALGRERAWLTETVRIEAAFERVSSSAITEDARLRQLASMQLSLARFEIETLELDSESAAREAFLCVRDDGASLADLGAESGYRAERAEIWMDTLDETLAQQLLSAAEGEVIEPVAVDGGFKVYHVLRKFEPSVTDRAVSDRLDQVIVDQFFAELCIRHLGTRDVVPTEQ
jgi:hypothetical protein